METDGNFGLAPIKQEPLNVKIATILKTMIYQGKFPPGTRLTEENIAQELEVSRVPVREAIRSLEKFGLVKIIPGQGAHVTELKPKDIDEIFSVRLLLEVKALELCIRNNREASTKKLEKQIDTLQKLIQQPGVSRFDIIEQDVQFDEILCKMCGNHLIYELWEIVSARIRLAFSINPFYDQNNLEGRDPCDQMIVEAMKAGEEEKAIELLKEHLISAQASTLKAHAK